MPNDVPGKIGTAYVCVAVCLSSVRNEGGGLSGGLTPPRALEHVRALMREKRALRNETTSSE